MTTEYVWSPEAKDDLPDSSNQLCKHLDDFSNLSEQLIKTCKINEEIEKGEPEDGSKDVELEQKKPRRKDTPVQYDPPLIPVCRKLDKDLPSIEIAKHHLQSEKEKQKRVLSESLSVRGFASSAPTATQTSIQTISNPSSRSKPPIRSGSQGGVKLMKEEKQPVLAEDDEKDAEKLST